MSDRVPVAGERWERVGSVGHPLSDFVTIHHADAEVVTFRDWTGGVWANKTANFLRWWNPPVHDERPPPNP